MVVAIAIRTLINSLRVSRCTSDVRIVTPIVDIILIDFDMDTNTMFAAFNELLSISHINGSITIKTKSYKNKNN